MKKLIPLFLMLITFTNVNAQCKKKKLTFQEARKNKSISFTGLVKSIGNNRRLKLAVKNNSKDSLQIEMEAGRIFYCNDNSLQPFVVYRSKSVILGPNEEKDSYVDAVCGNASASGCPDGYKGFTRTEMGSDALVGTLNEMEKSDILAEPYIQTLVWIFTNDHPIASLGRKGDSNSPTELIAIVSKYKGQDVPIYQVRYHDVEEGSSLTFSGKPKNISSQINIKLTEQEDLRIVLKDKNGLVVRYAQHIQNQPPGDISIPLDLDLTGLSQGNYELVVETSAGLVKDNQKIAI